MSSVSDFCCDCFSDLNCTPFLGSTVEVDSTTACGITPTVTYYHSVVFVSGIPNTEPEIGNTINSNQGCGNPLLDQAGFIKFGTQWIEIDVVGDVIAKGNC